MHITNELTDEAAIGEIGSRIAQARLNRNLSQATLAERAGVTPLTVHKIESGAPGQTRNLIRVLRALGMLSSLDVGIPEQVASPIEQSDLGGRRRQRARAREQAASSAGPKSQPWVWGDSK